VNNFRLPFRGWSSTVPVDRYFFTRQSNVDLGPINQKYTTFSRFFYANQFFDLCAQLFVFATHLVCVTFKGRNHNRRNMTSRLTRRLVFTYLLHLYHNYLNRRFNVMTKNVIACIAVRCRHIVNHEYLCPLAVDLNDVGGRDLTWQTVTRWMTSTPSKRYTLPICGHIMIYNYFSHCTASVIYRFTNTFQ